MHAKKFSYRITANPRTYIEQQEVWTSTPKVRDNKLEAKWIKLEDVYCPACTKGFAVKTFKMRNRLGHFSKLHCKSCQQKTSSSLWCCDCGERWTKCRVHQHFPTKYAPRPIRKRTIRDDIGIDVPQPKVRKICTDRFAVEDNGPAAKRIRLNAGSKLAAKFPHLV